MRSLFKCLLKNLVYTWIGILSGNLKFLFTYIINTPPKCAFWGVHMLWHECGGQRSQWSQFSLYTCMWVCGLYSGYQAYTTRALPTKLSHRPFLFETVLCDPGWLQICRHYSAFPVLGFQAWPVPLSTTAEFFRWDFSHFAYLSILGHA